MHASDVRAVTTQQVTGGRNGYGAKLANIFSTEFIIETADGKRGRKYRQRFHDNMNAKEEPALSSCKASENHTRVTFTPDLAKFGMDFLEADTIALMRKRVYDLAGVLGKSVKVRRHVLTLKRAKDQIFEQSRM